MVPRLILQVGNNRYLLNLHESWGDIRRNTSGSRNLFGGGANQGPQSKVKGEVRISEIEGAKRPM